MELESKYFLPFDTSEHPIQISQGNNGPWSHFITRKENPRFPERVAITDLAYAVDFALPLNSIVKAARSGIVYGFLHESDWYYEGLDPKIGNHPPIGATNFIFILHDDGTIGTYSHLNRTTHILGGSASLRI